VNLNTSYLNKTPNKEPRGTTRFIPQFVVMHETAGYGSLDWNLKPSVRSSYNYLISRNGTIYHYVDEQAFIAWHAGVNSSYTINGAALSNGQLNIYSIGVEIEGPNDGTPITAAQTASAILLMLHFKKVYNIPIDSDHYQGHEAVAPGYKTDPDGYSVKRLIKLAEADDTLDTRPFTPQTRIVDSPVVLPAEHYIGYIIAQGGDPDRARRIVALYLHHGATLRLDPLGSIAQMLHETDSLKSWWSAPPRRNLCGLGVTGVTRKTASPHPGWQTGRQPGIEEAGYAFSNDEAAVLAHLTHLGAYVYTRTSSPGAFNRDYDPRIGAVELAGWRGVATVWADLNKRWAYPGDNYATGVARKANEIIAFDMPDAGPRPPEIDPRLSALYGALGGLGRDVMGLGWVPGPGYPLRPAETAPDGDGIIQYCERYVIGLNRDGKPRIPLLSELEAWKSKSEA
jgi:hypothetical protein